MLEKFQGHMRTVAGVQPCSCVWPRQLAALRQCLSELLIAILLFADDIALFSYTTKGLQRQLDILHAFCPDKGSKVNVQKTKTMVFEHQKSQVPPFTHAWSQRV